MNNSNIDTPVHLKQFLSTAFSNGYFASDDVVAFIIDALAETIELHSNGKVLPTQREDCLLITENRLDINEQIVIEKQLNTATIQRIDQYYKQYQFAVLAKQTVEVETAVGNFNHKNRLIHLGNTDELTEPAYLLGYYCFESTWGHHDELTDIFSLGLVLGSICFGLNLYDPVELERFVEIRDNAFGHSNIHPTLVGLVQQMTALDRTKRIQDLQEVIDRLTYYRDYNIENTIDLTTLKGWKKQEQKSLSQFILGKLRNRLFDNSRRNRLLYYKANSRFVNLTVGSVPNVLNYTSVKPEHLFSWHQSLANTLLKGNEVILNKYVRFDDHKYLSGALDKIRVEARRSVQEYGFNQLRLVITMLNWHNFKEIARERIQTPLLLLPIEIKKVKKLNEDFFTIKVLNNEAEVNPVLANLLRDLYNIQLPDFIDLEATTIDAFFEQLKQQIEQSKQGITIHLENVPRIKLIHTLAKQTIQNHARKQNLSNIQYHSYKDLDYSYKPEYYKPLGLEIYKARVKDNPSYLELLVNSSITLNRQNANGKEREFFELVEANSNPYQWEMDTCNIILGNFNYKKMSLVRDYNQIIDADLNHAVFNELFSTNSAQKELKGIENSIKDWYHVIQADATQTQAVQIARTGINYIIQGPPGTGKSQTITNLIADYIAQGKTILFVCEKRAALDVVYHRLKQVGLADMCCYIHDSQEDKKEFVQDLKAKYELLNKGIKPSSIKTLTRQTKLNQLHEHIQLLNHYHQSNTRIKSQNGISIRKLLDNALALQHIYNKIPKPELQRVPSYQHWLNHKQTIIELSAAIEKNIGERCFAAHPASLINENLFAQEDSLQQIETLLTNLQAEKKNISKTINELTTLNPEIKIHELKQLLQLTEELAPFVKTKQLGVLSQSDEAYTNYDNRLEDLQEQEAQYSKIQNKNWIQKFSLAEAEQALGIAQKHEQSFFKFLNGDWRKVKKATNSNYSFQNHQIKPTITNILEQLIQELKFEEKLNNDQAALKKQYAFFTNDQTLVNNARQLVLTENGRLLVENQPIAYALYEQQQILRNYFNQVFRLLAPNSTLELANLPDTIDTLHYNREALLELKIVLKAYSQLPEEVKTFLRNTKLSPPEIEAGITLQSVVEELQLNSQFASADFVHLNHTIATINNLLKELLNINVDVIQENNSNDFISTIQLSIRVDSQLDTEQKAIKRNIFEGKKILENEFGKSIRFKSIRELVEKESGTLLKKIKPVWLMSPFSVSDSLPLEPSLFDVVIFDEASQITLEEGVPALYRGQQVIIVGDDKQMPPTNFFTSKAEDPDDFNKTFDGEEFALNDDTDSILIQGVRKLSNTMLRWHYRSHFETLISYSNHAFYQANLFTIPDKAVHDKAQAMAPIEKSSQAPDHIHCLYDRSISYHHYPKAIYEHRSNKEEANYIAELVRTLLLKGIKESIGIVAFSQEQQATIEDALTSLASTDKEFEKKLEEAYDRHDEGQYVGLIVKNLENIQGDERDFIILSICYGPGRDGKMLMNFGPINKKGGEKRLNVIFSRARKHVAVISTIKHHQITNEYNEGANYLRKYLQYAESVSNGDMELANIILNGISGKETLEEIKSTENFVTAQIKNALIAKGKVVATNIGQSKFKCSLAVKENAEDDKYTLAILVDDETHYDNPDIIEQYAQRKEILKNMGWRVLQVFAKDWWQYPDKVMEMIEDRLHNDEKVVETTPIAPPTEAVTAPTIETVEAPINESLERYTHTEDGHAKFWEISKDEEKLVIKFGRIGTKGQAQIKSFENALIAEKEMQKLIREKLKKGYIKT
jgi:predicted DNA-binding WGR domain protein